MRLRRTLATAAAAVAVVLVGASVCEDRVTVVVPDGHGQLACVVAHTYPPPPPVDPELPEPQRFLGRFALLYGMGVGTLCYAIGFAVSLPALGSSDDMMSWFGVWILIAVIVTLGVLFAGVTCVSIQRTRAFGAGLLISLAIGIIVGNGACFAVLSTT